MELKLLAGSAHPRLAADIAGQLGTPLCRCDLRRFPDLELHVQLQDSVRGHDVFVVQPTSPPVETHIFELLLLADACRRADAGRITAVVPYFGYARQDRRAGGREPVTARLVADLMRAAGLQRVVAVDLHSPAIEGFFSVPVEQLTAVTLLADSVRGRLASPTVVVAPDLGAAKLADRYAQRLDLPVAIVHKQRLGAEKVAARRITGEVRGLAPLIVDDMISTGGTIEAASTALIAAGCAPEITVLATHALLVGAAVERLIRLPLRLVTTDTVANAQRPAISIDRVSLAPLLAAAIERLHKGESLEGLAVHQ